MPKKFGDLVNGDTIVAQSDEAMGLTGERDALAMVDQATVYTDCFPLMSRTTPDAHGAIKEFMGDVVPKRIYTDNAPELIKACKQLRYPHDKSTPYRHQSNAYCERTVRSIVEGARTLLERAGLPSCFWIFAVRFWCFMHNTEVKDGESPWNARHQDGHFPSDLRMPFGSLVSFMPKPETVKAMPKFEPRGQRGILVGYRLHNGGKWTRGYQVFPVRYFDDYDYSRPRNLLELVPVTTQEVTRVGAMPEFPLKAAYDAYKSVPSSLPLCMIRDAKRYAACDEMEEKPDTDDAGEPGGGDADGKDQGELVEGAVSYTHLRAHET